MKLGNNFATLITAMTLSINTSFAQEPVWDGNKVNLISEQLAGGVYAYYPSDAKELERKGLPVATSGGFIIGDNGVLIIDTMLNERLNNQVQKIVQQKAKQPIIYAVNTSYHGDHSYGNLYLPEETIIIQHEESKRYIDNHFKADTEFMIQTFGKGRGIEAIKPVSADILISKDSMMTLDLGGKQVEIIDFGFAQTGGDLFIWEPKSKVMWTGNSIVAIKPSLPWLLDGHIVETLNTLKKVYDFLPEDARIVPGHGSVMNREDLLWHIDYLQALQTQVQQAIDKGLTLKQTVEKVKLPEFAGYSLFGWVHPGLNVPVVYKELSTKN